MFTGIIEEVGRLKNLDGGRIEIACEKILEDMKIGDSISTNGICLTVVDFGENFFAADVMPETLRRTSLADKNFNLERAVKVGDRLGGHIVSGHIDGVGKILSIRPEGNALLIDVAAENLNRGERFRCARRHKLDGRGRRQRKFFRVDDSAHPRSHEF